MRLSYDNLLLHLAHDYNNVLLHHTTSRSNYSNRYHSYSVERKKRKRQEEGKEDELREIEEIIVVLLCLRNKRRRIDEAGTSRSNRIGMKYERNHYFFTDPETGGRYPMTYRHSLWYQNYIVNVQPDKMWWCKLFRERFRLPYDSFVELVEICKQSDILKQWADNKTKRYNPKQGAPMELLVLCVLRYLGRAWTICDLQESVIINKETIRLFINKFIEFGSTTLFEQFVMKPGNKNELDDCNNEFRLAGLPGCIGSTDATHVVTERCIYTLRQLHLGYKKEHTARTYNLTVNHRRRILSTTKGHPARFNDKTLIRYDRFVNLLKDGSFDNLFDFELYDYDQTNNQIIKVKYTGCYVIVDNGYLRWSVTVPPMKESHFRNEIRFSEWIESMRKDVECAFGILKGRWRVLRYGIKLWGIKNTDKVWLTCCALHNWLLEVDGLSDGWENGAKSYWECELDNQKDIPFAIKRLNAPSKSRNMNMQLRDLSGMGCGNDVQNISIEDAHDVETDMMETREEIESIKTKGRIPIKNLSLDYFRRKLIRHFNIAFQKDEVSWPKRIKKNKDIVQI